MGSRTALMIEPFEGEPDNRGLAVTPADTLWELAVQADRAGFPLSIHAIGDLAVREVLDVLSEFPFSKQGSRGAALRQAQEPGQGSNLSPAPQLPCPTAPSHRTRPSHSAGRPAPLEPVWDCCLSAAGASADRLADG